MQAWLDAAARDEPVWIGDVRQAAGMDPEGLSLTLRLQGFDGRTRDFFIPVPRWETGTGRDFAWEYLRAAVFNILSVHSGSRAQFLYDRENSDIRGLLRRLPAAFQIGESRRVGYGKATNVADRLCRSFGGGPFS